MKLLTELMNDEQADADAAFREEIIEPILEYLRDHSSMFESEDYLSTIIDELKFVFAGDLSRLWALDGLDELYDRIVEEFKVEDDRNYVEV